MKFFADVDEDAELLPDELAAALDEPLELDELLLLPQAASASAATAPTMHVPMRPLFNITRNSLSKLESDEPITPSQSMLGGRRVDTPHNFRLTDPRYHRLLRVLCTVVARPNPA